MVNSIKELYDKAANYNLNKIEQAIGFIISKGECWTTFRNGCRGCIMYNIKVINSNVCVVKDNLEYAKMKYNKLPEYIKKKYRDIMLEHALNKF